MQRITLFIFSALILFLSGCGNLSPRQHQQIDNQDGKIDEIKNNQNGLMAEIGNLKQQNEIANSRLDRIQQGLANFQTNSDNHGIQILSGSGGLLIAFIGTIVIGLFYYRNQAKIHEQTANLLAEKIVRHNDPILENNIFESVLHTNIAKNVLQLIKKHQDFYSGIKR